MYIMYNNFDFSIDDFKRNEVTFHLKVVKTTKYAEPLHNTQYAYLQRTYASLYT